MTDLAEHGIRLRREQPGEHRTACPRCAEAKHRPRDDALAVKVEPDGGATWVCHRCGWTGSLRPPGAPQRPARAPRRPPPRPASEHRPQPFSDLDARRWSRAKPILPGTPPADYLGLRGCALPDPEGDLRWHPKVRNWTCGHVGPALLALVTDPATAAPMTLHFTWIRPDGSGKADVAKPRLYLAGHEKRGGVVRLWPDDDLTYGLCVGEGIETCLTAAHAFTPAWACLDAGNLGELPVLPGVEALTIVADHDKAGITAANACGQRWADAGCEVRIWKAPVRGADLNDYAREAAA
jgi:putative DNA primase/helicase